MIETLHLLDPNFKMIVCLRDLRQIFGSIEHQHAQTRLIDFPGHIDADSAANRFKTFFAEERVIGWALNSIKNMQNIDSNDVKRAQRNSRF